MCATVHNLKIVEGNSYDYLFEMVLKFTGAKFDDVLPVLAERVFNTRRMNEVSPASLRESKALGLVEVDLDMILPMHSDAHQNASDLGLNICPWEAAVELATMTNSYPLDVDTTYYMPIQSVSEDGAFVKGMFVFGKHILFVSEFWLKRSYHVSAKQKGKLIYMC